MPSHYLNQRWNITNSKLRNKFHWYLKQNTRILINKNAFENVVCEMVTILSWSQCVNLLPGQDLTWPSGGWSGWSPWIGSPQYPTHPHPPNNQHPHVHFFFNYIIQTPLSFQKFGNFCDFSLPFSWFLGENEEFTPAPTHLSKDFRCPRQSLKYVYDSIGAHLPVAGLTVQNNYTDQIHYDFAVKTLCNRQNVFSSLNTSTL